MNLLAPTFIFLWRLVGLSLVGWVVMLIGL